MSQIDWSKAPEGATHYGETTRTSYFYRIPGDLGGSYDCWNANSSFPKWSRGNTEPAIGNLIPRPPTEWNGDGRPPVGTVCEWHPDQDGWRTITILGHDGSDTWYRDADGIADTVRNIAFLRPIRTPEQIAAEEREAAIMQMIRDAGREPVERTKKQAARLYDAGYRKQEQTK